MAFGSAKTAPTGEYTLSSSRQATENWVADNTGRLVIDIETAGGLIRHPSQRELLCLGLYNGREAFIVPEDQFLGGVWPEMYELLSECFLVGHNIKFDTMTLSWYLIQKNAPLKVGLDTQVVHAILYPAAQKHSLDAIVERWYGWESWSLKPSEYMDMRSVPLEKLYSYLSKDITGTGQLAGDEWAMLAHNENAANVTNNMMPVVNMMAEEEWYGVCIDADYTNGLLEEVKKESQRALLSVQDKADAILEKYAIVPSETWPRSHGEGSVKGKPVWIHRFNPSSPKQVSKLYDIQGIKLNSTDAKQMDKLAEGGDEFAPVLLDYRAAQKLIGTYILPNVLMPEQTLSQNVMPDTRRFPTYKLFGVSTGRTAAADPNIQNQPRPKRVRRMFVPGTATRLSVPSKGKRLLVQADYSQAELRVMAALGNDKWLIEMFSDDSVDIFSQMLPMAFPHRKAQNAEEAKDMRAKLKGVVYGLSFGRQARAIGLSLGMSPADAQGIIDRFLGAASGLATWRESVFTRLHDGTGLRTRFGRYFQVDVITPKNKAAIERSALSFEPQGSASDCCMMSAVDLFKWIKENNKDWCLFAFVHDSITLDVPEEDAEEASFVMRSFLVKHAEKWFPEVKFAADGKWGTSWDQTG